MGEDSLKSIAAMMIDETARRAKEERDIIISPTAKLLDMVKYEGGSTAGTNGARPKRRAVQRYFEDAASEAIIGGFLNVGDEAVLDFLEEGKICVMKTGGECMVVDVEEESGGIGMGGVKERVSNTNAVAVNGDSNVVVV